MLGIGTQKKTDAHHSSNLIGEGTVLEGIFNTPGDLRVEGKIKGSISSKSRVVVGHTGMVEGDVLAQSAEVSGQVHGSTRVSGLLTLRSTAVVQGDIIAAKLVFEEGAKFNGKCNMGGPAKQVSTTNDAHSTSLSVSPSRARAKAPESFSKVAAGPKSHE